MGYVLSILAVVGYVLSILAALRVRWLTVIPVYSVAACSFVIGCSAPTSTDKSGTPEEPKVVAQVATEPGKKQGLKPGIVELYKKLEIGMSRLKAEEILGQPVFAPLEGSGEDLRVYYLGPEYAERSLLPHESPFAPAGIFVTYRRGTLVEKGYNSQWVKQ